MKSACRRNMSRRDYYRLRWEHAFTGSKAKRRKGGCRCPICIGRFPLNRTVRERAAHRFEEAAG